MSKEPMTPKIRFEGFEGEWSLEKLSDKVEYFSGLTYSPEDVSKYGTLVLRSSNVKNKEIVVEDTVFVNPEIVNSINVKKGDIIMVVRNGSRSLIGKNSVIEEDMPNTVIGAFMTGMRSDTPRFISALLDTPLFKIEIDKNMGATINQITGGMLNNMSFYFPTKEERIHIGKIISHIDNNIYLKNKELDNLTQYKQAMLQKMFPKEGETVPEVRFEEFEGEWRNTTLSEVAEIHGGGTPSTSIPEYWNGDIDWYAPAEINGQNFVSKSQKTITEFGLQKSSTKILPIGTVLFTSRAGIGKTAILAKEGTTNQGFQSIVPNKNQLDSYFIYARTDELKRYGEEKGAGSTFVEVSGKQMAKMPIRIPLLKEQKKIGEYFKALDNNIQSKQSELDKLKQFKQAMLEKMFV